MKTVRFEDGHEFVVVNVDDEPCPICETPFKNSYCTWNLFHGEVSYSCCNSPYQIKDYYPEDDYPEELKEFIKNIGKNGNIVLKIKSEWIEPLNNAIKETGIRNVGSDEVFESAKIHKERIEA